MPGVKVSEREGSNLKQNLAEAESEIQVIKRKKKTTDHEKPRTSVIEKLEGALLMLKEKTSSALSCR